MSRRDTIIIAVLINAGLLMILFATAMPSKDEELPSEAKAVAVAEPQEVKLAEKESISITPRDEVDKVLSEWNIKPTVSGEKDEFSYIANTPAVEEDEAEETKADLVQESTKESSKYTVVKGDSLDKIAKKQGTTVEELMTLNGLTKKSVLKIGQVLTVPGKAKKEKEKESKYYIVKSGDNPAKIASKNNVKVSELLKWNNLDDDKARKLKPGDKLKIK